MQVKVKEHGGLIHIQRLSEYGQVVSEETYSPEAFEQLYRAVYDFANGIDRSKPISGEIKFKLVENRSQPNFYPIK